MSSMTVKVFKGKEWREVVSTLEGAITKMIDNTGTPAVAAAPTPDATPTPPPSPLAPAVPEFHYKPPAVDLGNAGCCSFATPQFFDKQPAPNIYMGQPPPIISQQPMYSHNGMLVHDVYQQQAGYIQRQVGQ